MNDNYIKVNGKVIPLTEEQIMALTEANEPEKQDNFERVKGDSYFFMDEYLETQSHYEAFDDYDYCLYGIGNYHKDKATMQQLALKVQLMLLLLRFQEQNGGDAEWDSENIHCCIAKDTSSKYKGAIDSWHVYKSPIEVYFKDNGTADQAYREVVKPFLAQHPEFQW